MPGTLSYNRRRVDVGGTIGDTGEGGEAAAAGRVPCRYYGTERRRNRYSSFSIMKLFRRSKHYDDDDSAWFRDDLQRIRQAYREQEPDYAAVTPMAERRRPAAAATWSRWSGSTTTVYSFAYVDGAPRDDYERTAGRRDGRGADDVDDVVEYIDAATLPVAHRRRTDREQSKTPSTTAGTSGRANQTAGTMTATRRRNKRIAPPPPVVATTAQTKTAGAPTTVQRRVAGTISRKKYRAPQPPAPPTNGSSEPRPQQQRGLQACRRAAPAQRRRKGPAPKPPVVQQQQQPPPPVAATAVGSEAGSNVKRKISQYERDRLMERVDKIEKHFFDKTAETAAARRHGFASPAALYTAMAATNLTELDKRAAEICRQRNQRGAAMHQLTAAVPLTADHKNAIVSAVIRKSYPTATAATVADGGRRPDRQQQQQQQPTSAAADDEKRLVRHKRLAFFQQQRPTGLADERPVTASDKTAAAAAAAAAVPDTLSRRTTRTKSAAVAAKKSEVHATPATDTPVRTGDGGRSSAAGTVHII